jgi:hypothetical protein
MVRRKFRFLSAALARTRRPDAAALDGVGASIRAAFPIPIDEAGEQMRELISRSIPRDEGDERMRELIVKLREIEARPDAPLAPPRLL